MSHTSIKIEDLPSFEIVRRYLALAMVMAEWCGPRCSSVVCGSGSMADSERLHLTPSPHSGTLTCNDSTVGIMSK